MAVYMIADIKITDESWIPDYTTHVHHIVSKHGGKYLSRSANVRTVEGDDLDTSVVGLLEFPSMESVEAFANDPDYAKHRRARQAGSLSNFHVIDDTDVAGTIPYLPKG